MAEKKTFNINFLQVVAIIVALIGAIGSLGLMFYAGRYNKSVLLLLLFAGWVLSPFIGLFVASKISNRWPVLVQKTIYILMLALTLISLVSYSAAMTLHKTKPAFIFLIVSPASWFFILTVIQITRRLSRNSNDKM